ncbi:hypothetical protein PVW51_01040 [Sulfitobacter sp. PR48]|uniref:MAPEG family protein n=1 Tax=Sulfitobacter porphyrae TaxID=1246864 RepID=A0ABW2B6C7_9RHOB|nr:MULTISPECIES: hypothetical protein [unclassified Sulfitobacter]MCZ4255939.1 hypothetical protein [Sulfitobacter sp. G21635-S1]MDD9719250.1 hypothetical protein [Sulfitobacter sp. PR48]GLT11739.1 hypothetical protein GCM10007928_39710 [Sulfitobacter porphyrae]
MTKESLQGLILTVFFIAYLARCCALVGKVAEPGRWGFSVIGMSPAQRVVARKLYTEFATIFCLFLTAQYFELL